MTHTLWRPRTRSTSREEARMCARSDGLSTDPSQPTPRGPPCGVAGPSHRLAVEATVRQHGPRAVVSPTSRRPSCSAPRAVAFGLNPPWLAMFTAAPPSHGEPGLRDHTEPGPTVRCNPTKPGGLVQVAAQRRVPGGPTPLASACPAPAGEGFESGNAGRMKVACPVVLPASLGPGTDGDSVLICSEPPWLPGCAGLMPGRGVVGVLAHIAADGSRGRLDNHGAIDERGGGKPARRDVRMVQAHPGTAVHTDPGRVRSAAEPGAVETVHRPGTSPGRARLVMFMCRASASGRRRGPGRRDRRSARPARPAPPDAAGRT